MILNASVRGRVYWLSLRLVALRKLPPVKFFFVLETSSDLLTASSPSVYLFMKISGGKLELAVISSWPLISNLNSTEKLYLELRQIDKATRMHSSRMRTVCCSGCPGLGICQPVGCLTAKGDVCLPEGCVPREGVSARPSCEQNHRHV